MSEDNAVGVSAITINEPPADSWLTKAVRKIQDMPWSMIQVYAMALLGIAFAGQYIIVIFSIIYYTELQRDADPDFENLSRKDPQVKMIRIMNMNPLGADVPYPWLVYGLLFSGVFILMAFTLFIIKFVGASSQPGHAAFKKLVDGKKRAKAIAQQVRDVQASMKNLDNLDITVLRQFDVHNATANNLIADAEKLQETLDNGITEANKESGGADPAAVPFEATLAKLEAEAKAFVKTMKESIDVQKRKSKKGQKQEPKPEKKQEVQAGGAFEAPEGGRFKPNWILMGPILFAGVVCMFTGIATFIMFAVKVQNIRKLSMDVEYESVIRENIPQNNDYLDALREYVMMSTKVSPYAWPTRTVNMSFDPESKNDLEEVVRIMFFYRLASHYVENIASLEGESKAYAASAVGKRSSALASMTGDVSAILGLLSTTYVSDMAPYRRFRGDIAYDDVAALNELLRCPLERCPPGRVTFAAFYKAQSPRILQQLSDLSMRLSKVVDSMSYGQRIVTQWSTTKEFLDNFQIMHVYVPVAMLVAAGAYCHYMIDDDRLRSIAVGGFTALVALPIAVKIVA